MEQKIHTASTDVHQARSSSEAAWQSEAGESFRGGMSRMAPKIDDVGTDHAGMCRELNKHADNLDTVKQRVEQARHHAREAGLEVHGDQIMEPGPEPTPPAPLPSDKPATPEQQQAHAAGTQAQTAYARKVQAYQECSQTITDARNVENSSLGVLNRFVSGLVEKSPFTVTDVMSGLAGAVATRTSAFRATATSIANSGKLERAARLMHSPKLKSLVQMNLNFGAKPQAVGNKVLRGSLKVGSKLPVVGLGVAVTGIGFDVGVSGKDATTSAASNLGGWAAGAGASAAVLAAGGPVGWAVGLGAVASVGVGFAIEEWGDDAVDLAGDAASAVGDAANAVGDWASDLF